jgi:ferredoxin--NADP+ reductase
VLRKYADELPLGSAELAAYLCGNPQMIDNARGVLRRARVAPEQIHTEQYFPLPKA